jgi:arginine/lysine/ornithine decarboxylase
MPGHKRNKNYFEGIGLLEYDMTEFEGMDNFHNPKGIIAESQKQAAHLFGTKGSYYLTNGSTSGIMAAISAVYKDGGKILAARNSHRSFYNALLLTGASPVYVYPNQAAHNLTGGVNPKDIENALINNPDIKAVYITSPTYEGLCSDIKAISKITKRHNKILIVDEAHGAHFIFSKYFPDSAINYADIVIQSLHKTMPTLGQASILHVLNDKIDNELLQFYISLFHTSSPSYIILASIDRLIKKLIDKKIAFDEYVDLLLEYRKRYIIMDCIPLLDKEAAGPGYVSDFDISKLCFFTSKTGLTSSQVNDILLNKFSIQTELSYKNYFMALSSVCDTPYGFRLLENALAYIGQNAATPQAGSKNIAMPKATIKLSIKEAMALGKTKAPLKDAINKISANFITPYPPGIPLTAPGEVITEEIFNVINELCPQYSLAGHHSQQINMHSHDIMGLSPDFYVDIVDI